MRASSQAAVEQEPIALEPRRSGRVRREIERYGFLVTDSGVSCALGPNNVVI